MKFTKMATLALRNMGRNRRRSFLSALALGITALSMVFVFSLLDGLFTDMKKNLIGFSTGHISIRHSEYEKKKILQPLGYSVQNPFEFAQALEAQPQILQALPRIPFGAAVYLEEKNYSVFVLGLLPQKEEVLLKPSTYLSQGKLPRDGEREVVLGFALAQELGKGIGDKLEILARTRGRSSNMVTYTISGLANYPTADRNRSMILMPLDQAQNLLRLTNASLEILLVLQPEVAPSSYQAIAEDLNAQFASNPTTESYKAQAWNSPGLYTLILEYGRMTYDFIALIIYLLGSVVVVNTTMMVIIERTREIGTLSALGLKGKELVQLILLEALGISIVGAGTGVILGSILTIIISLTGLDFSSAMAGVDFDLSPIWYPALSLQTVLVVFVSSVAVSGLASWLPARRAIKIHPAEALRSPT